MDIVVTLLVTSEKELHIKNKIKQKLRHSSIGRKKGCQRSTAYCTTIYCESAVKVVSLQEKVSSKETKSHHSSNLILKLFGMFICFCHWQHNKKSKCSNNPYLPYMTSLQSCSLHNQPSQNVYLLHVIVQCNDCKCSSFQATFWLWIKIKAIQTGLIRFSCVQHHTKFERNMFRSV